MFSVEYRRSPAVIAGLKPRGLKARPPGLPEISLCCTMNAGMKTSTEFVTTAPGTEGLYEMANLSPKKTGLPFVVWISPQAGAPHDVRVKVSKGPRVHPSELISVAIRPEVHVVGGHISAHDLALLQEWVELNREVLIKYWDGDIAYTEDAIAALTPVHSR